MPVFRWYHENGWHRFTNEINIEKRNKYNFEGERFRVWANRDPKQEMQMLWEYQHKSVAGFYLYTTEPQNEDLGEYVQEYPVGWVYPFNCSDVIRSKCIQMHRFKRVDYGICSQEEAQSNSDQQKWPKYR